MLDSTPCEVLDEIQNVILYAINLIQSDAIEDVMTEKSKFIMTAKLEEVMMWLYYTSKDPHSCPPFYSKKPW